MDIETSERLTHRNDMGIAASAIRLRAAIALTGMQHKDFAAAAGVTKQVVSNVLSGLAYPNHQVMRYLYRMHRIDFNFLLNGDFAQLPGDVQDRLFPALEVANSAWDRKEGSGQGPVLPIPLR